MPILAALKPQRSSSSSPSDLLEEEEEDSSQVDACITLELNSHDEYKHIWDEETLAELRKLTGNYDEISKRRCSWTPVRDSTKINDLPRLSVDDLQEAALRGDLETVRRLVGAGVSVNAPIRAENENEWMCLLHVLAVKRDHPNVGLILREIIWHSANLNVRSSLGATPLSRACMMKHVEAVEVLLQARANVSAVDDHGRTAVTCAVVLRPGHDISLEVSRSVQIVGIFGKCNVNLNEGGDQPPIIEAVVQQRIELVEALLRGGATADGLHVAVESSDIDLITKLVEAEANPFKHDAEGRLVMDIALARGNEDISCLLRNYSGDLQRKQHPHVKTLNEHLRREAEADAQALLTSTGNIHRTVLISPKSAANENGGNNASWVETWLDSMGMLPAVSRWQQVCRKINKHQGFQQLMFVTLLFALFLPDTWVLLDISNTQVLDYLLLVILCVFLVEFCLQMVGSCRNYVCSFFFWMDLVGVLSIPLDHSLIVNNMPSGIENTAVMRSARMAKLGARAGRFMKLISRIKQRVLSGKDDTEERGDTAKVMSGILNHSLSVRVSSLIIAMVFLLPIFEMWTYPRKDNSLKMWTQEIAFSASDSFHLSTHDKIPCDEMKTVFDLIEAFFKDQQFFPYEAWLEFANLSSATNRSAATCPLSLSRGVPVRTQNKVLTEASYGGVNVEMLYNFETPNKMDSLWNVIMILVIIFMMMGSVLLLSNSVSHIAMVPLAQFFEEVRGIGAKIFDSVASLTGKEQAMEGEDDEDNNDPMGSEANLLERVLTKIGVLSQITMKASPLDAEQLKQLDDRDRAMLQGYGGINSQAAVQTKSSRQSEIDQPGLAKQSGKGAIWRHATTTEFCDSIPNLIEAGLPREIFDNWGFNVLDASEVAKERLCLSALLLHRTLTDPDVTSRARRFIHSLALSYRKTYLNEEKKEGLFHNWTHAVDTTFTTIHILSLCGSDCFLSARERFALVVAAMSHDVGNWGFNDQFLVTVTHELAIRYNDSSPLENMSAAKVFELVTAEGCRMLSDFTTEQYREVRTVIVDAILHTDFIHHKNMVKEVQGYMQMKGEVFRRAEEHADESENDFFTKEVVDFFRGPDVKRQLRQCFVHLADISFPTKPWNVAESWASMLAQEMFLQGDVEKEFGIPIGPLNDREKVNISYAQIGFIDLFVAPLALGFGAMMPYFANEAIDCMLTNLDSWYARWTDEVQPPEDEQQLLANRISDLVRAPARNGSDLCNDRLTKLSVVSSRTGGLK